MLNHFLNITYEKIATRLGIPAGELNQFLFEAELITLFIHQRSDPLHLKAYWNLKPKPLYIANKQDGEFWINDYHKLKFSVRSLKQNITSTITSHKKAVIINIGEHFLEEQVISEPIDYFNLNLFCKSLSNNELPTNYSMGYLKPCDRNAVLIWDEVIFYLLCILHWFQIK